MRTTQSNQPMTAATMMDRLVRATALLSLFFVVIHAEGRDVTVVNQSGHRINVYWINRWNHDELVLNNSEGPVLFGADMSIKSFATHEFEVQEVPHSKTGVCGGPDEICRKAYFQVNDNEGQIVTIKKGFELVHEDNKSKARDQAKEMLNECKAKAIASASSPSENTMDALFECVNVGLQESLDKSQEEIDYQTGIRTKLGSHLAVYACADDKLNTTDPIRNDTYTSMDRKRKYTVRVFHDRPTSKIHYIENFITDEECRAVQKEDQAVLKQVNNADGLEGKQGRISASQSKYLASIQQKAVDYTNSVLNIDAQDYGQEQLLSILYGMGEKYNKHCDGKCDGEPHKEGERVATLNFYCQTADKGGSTIFHNAGIYVKPKKGGAVFVSYVDPITSHGDTGFTEYMGCPVREGEKRVVTQYVRLGEAEGGDGEPEL